MAIGVGISRSARAGGRRAKTSRPTVREVCLIGLDHSAGSQAWTTGQEVTWLGRAYRIKATVAASSQPVDDGSCPASPRHYVHLAPCNGD